MITEGSKMAKAPIPEPEFFRQSLTYYPDTGKLFWKHKPASLFEGGKFSPERCALSWNAKYAGKEAFTCIANNGYFVGRIRGRNYLAHRVIWAIVHGEWPEDQIDHINGDRTDNRVSNLRPADTTANAMNMGLRSDNQTGCAGVGWLPKQKKWRARIKVDGREKYLGHFDTFEEAKAARLRANKRHGYSARHGLAE